MKTNTAGSKGLSMILMAAGAIMTIAALALDFMGNKASFRGPLLVIGVLAFVLGVYLFPTLKHHRKIVYVIFLFPLLFTFVVTVIIPLVLGIFYSMTDWTGIQFTKFVGRTDDLRIRCHQHGPCQPRRFPSGAAVHVGT